MIFIIDSPKYGKHEVEIDDEDWSKVQRYTWHVTYHHNKKVKAVTTNIKGKSVKLHKFLTGFSLTDHIDNNPLNNKKSNLRECSQKENTRNFSLSRRNTTGYKGVHWDKNRNKYQAYIQQDGKRKHLGRFENIIDAAQAYNKAALKYYGEFARLNVI